MSQSHPQNVQQPRRLIKQEELETLSSGEVENVTIKLNDFDNIVMLMEEFFSREGLKDSSDNHKLFPKLSDQFDYTYTCRRVSIKRLINTKMNEEDYQYLIEFFKSDDNLLRSSTSIFEEFRVKNLFKSSIGSLQHLQYYIRNQYLDKEFKNYIQKEKPMLQSHVFESCEDSNHESSGSR
ncbi:hypothetical protein ABPG74_003755 [Tetrahymena malaccensis]